MTERGTWREYLAAVVSKPQEKQRILQALGLEARAIERWISGETSIPKSKLLRLLQELSRPQREHFVALIRQDPKLRQALVGTVYFLGEEAVIPSTFYMRVHDACAYTADRRLSTIGDLVLSQLQQQINPEQVGAVVSLLSCMSPAPSLQRPVRSLWLCTEQALAFRQGQTALFQGRESLTGYCVETARSCVIQQVEGERSFLPLHSAAIASMAAAPILRAGRIAGCLYMASVEPDFFTSLRQALLQRYSQLVALAFDDKDFYPQQQIALASMPPANAQPSMASFRQRLSQAASSAAQRKEKIHMEKLEEQLRAQLEDELLQDTATEEKEQ